MTEPVRLRSLFDLSGRVALVTGASNILGPEFSAALAEFGARVAMMDVDGPACAAAAERIRLEFGAEVEAHVGDVTDETAVATVVARVAERWGGIDVLVNAAATKSPGYFRPFQEYARADWDRVLEVNLTGMFVVTRQVLAGMVARGRGSIINIASQYGVVGPDPSLYEGSWYLDQVINTPAVYSASKAGVIGFTRHLATTLAGQGVRANAITPGGVFSGQNETFVQRYAERCPMGRMARREELRGAALFLASDASSYVTGHNLVVDGGWTVK
jgi:NAD(P)-dependent dehydrogenase (short-subunit alcohol dehydrogenase family)